MGLFARNISISGLMQGVFPQTPVASFTATPTRGSSGTLTVSFTDTSTGSPTAWLWDFKNDGTATSTQQNPTYTYTTPGTYSVKLTVNNSRQISNTTTATNIISFAPTPVASFTATPRTGTNTTTLTVQFTDTSTNNPTSWAWDFNNDGTVDSTLRNPTYTYASTGTYSVKLTASSQWGTSTSTQVNYITVSTGPAPADSSYTVLNLPGTGTNNTANNTFIDSSSNNFTVTRFGNTTQGSFSPFSTSAGYWSNYFDGNGDSLSLSNNTAFDFGTGAFTVEFWMNPVSTTANGGIIIDTRLTSGWVIHTNPDNTMRLTVTLGAIGITSSNTFNPQQWNHIALVRSGNTFRFYINGVSANSSTITNSMTADTVRIGIKSLSGSAVDPFNGYISNLRMVKGTALYTSDFTPSTTPLTAVTNTSLLTCQSNRFVDNSTNNFTITRNGDTSISSFGPFAPASSYNAATMGGSMYFDGSGDYLTIPNNTAFDVTASDFTMEAWVYRTVANTIHYIFSWRPALGSQGWEFRINADNTLQVFNNTPGAGSITSTATVVAGQWVHVAATRSGTTGRLFINGTQVATGTMANGVSTSTTFKVGADNVLAGNFQGYMSNARLVKGTAVYTANFTPPTAPVAAITGTSVLLNAINGAIVDQSTKNNLETLGDTKVSTTVSANGSMYFDGTGDYLTIPANINLAFGTGDFTAEFWIYKAASGTAAILDYASAGGFGINITDTQIVPFVSVTVGFASNAVVPLNTWTHVAVARQGTTLRTFMNGNLVGTATTSANFTSPSTLNIGRNPGAVPPTFFLNGYINDLRLTKGIARYTANFTPPTRS